MDTDGSAYAVISVSPEEKDCAKQSADIDCTYVMDCGDGNNVYADDPGTGIRCLSDDEYADVLVFAEKAFETDARCIAEKE